MRHLRDRDYLPYAVFLGVLLILVMYAFIMDSPGEIWNGLIRIHVSRSILVTDYVAVGGVGATLINSAMVGLFAVGVLVFSKVKPSGALIMALWLSIGFGCFGKNVINMMPLSLGVWLYSKVKKEPFTNFAVTTLLSATLSPVVSEVCFWYGHFTVLNTLAAIGLGAACGFIFPIISTYVVRVHGGYNLYNIGFAGGVISMLIATMARSLGVEFESALYWDTANSDQMAILVYLISFYLITVELVRTDVKTLITTLRHLYSETGRLPSDFYGRYGETIYLNMGIMGLLFTSTAMALGADLNGASVGGIFTIIGFGSFGKHLKNTLPVLTGAVLSTYANMWNPTAPTNTLAILFSTGLAPVAGEFGWLWGVVTGFLHVSMVHHSGYLNNGLNLYNNGFGAGLVALFVIPLAMSFKKDKQV